MKRGIFTSVVLSAFAVSIVSYAHAATNDWFDAGISAYDSWPGDGSNKVVDNQGVWTNTACATLEDAALAVNCTGDDKLTFEAASTVDAFAETTVVYSARMTFPANLTDVSELSDPGSGIKAGIAVAMSGSSLVYCGRAKDPDGSTDIWVVLSGATPVADVATDVLVSVKTENDVLKVQYAVGDTVLTYNDSSWLELAASETSLQGAKFAGTGYSLSALSAKTVTEEIAPPTIVELTLGELPENVTLVSVTTNGIGIAADEGVYYVFDHATVTVTFAAADGYVLTGSTTVVVNIDGDTEVSSESVPTAITPAQAIKINEIMASNPSVDKGGIASEKGIAEMDWIELYNGASVDVFVVYRDLLGQ